MKKKIKSIAFFAVLGAALCGSVYLNWYFGKTSETGKTLGEAKFVDTVPEDSSTGYFINARIDRKAVYDSSVEDITAVLQSDADSASKAKATERLNKLTEFNAFQNKIEQLVLAKGYKDCIAFTDEINTTVIVDADSLEAKDVLTIKDVVMRTTGQTAAQIQVTVINL